MIGFAGPLGAHIRPLLADDLGTEVEGCDHAEQDSGERISECQDLHRVTQMTPHMGLAVK